MIPGELSFFVFLSSFFIFKGTDYKNGCHHGT